MDIHPSPAPVPARRLPWLLLLVLLVAQTEALAHRISHLHDPGEALDCEVCLAGMALDSPLAVPEPPLAVAALPDPTPPLHQPCWLIARRGTHHPRDPPVRSG